MRQKSKNKGLIALLMTVLFGKTGLRLLLLVVLVLCVVLGRSKSEAAAKEKELARQKAVYEERLLLEEERQRLLEEESAYRQTKQYIEELAREKLGLVKPDEIILREEDAP
ncbi:MAG: septum formation initiator family protein [Lachnospiraceae bacterium]|nr:septum formation initiator family protein [Lachnospiraceae bacterium]